MIVGFQSIAENIPISQCTNLLVRWKATWQPWPAKLWVYQVLPAKLSPVISSNLITWSSLPKSHGDTNEMMFSGPSGVLQLRNSYGAMNYIATPRDFGPDYRPLNLPGTNELFPLTTNFLSKMGINLSEIPKVENGRPEIIFTEYPFTFFQNGVWITNLDFRTAWFYRAIDGVKCDSEIGAGRIEFGDNGKIIQIILNWQNLQRDKLYSAATPQTILQWIREGKAYQKQMVLSDREVFIDWSTVKSLTITNAAARYWRESLFDRELAHQSILPNGVFPYAEIFGTVDTGKTNLNVELICPVIDETQPLKASK